MSKRRPRRSVSSAITSSAPMLPRLTFGPTRRSSHACWERCGASKITVSLADRGEDRVHELAVDGAAGVEEPDRPALAPLGDDQRRARREVAKASRRTSRSATASSPLLLPTSAITVNSRGQLRDQLRLARARQRQRAVGDLDVIDPQLAQPLDVALEAALVDGDLQQRPARADRDAGVAADRDLVGHGAADVRGAPAELDHVDVLAGGDQQRLERERRQAAVDHVRDARPPRLDGAVRAGRGTPASCGAGREAARCRRVAACDRPWRWTQC